MREPAANDLTSLLRRLYDEHGASMYRYALMLLVDGPSAEDAVQQVFTALLRNRRAGEIRDAGAYLRGAVRNECYARLRHRRRWPEVSDQVLLETPSSSPGTSPDTRVALERALRALAPDQREVVHLHVFEGLTFREVADATGDSINTVASRYRNALAHMRRALDP